MLTGDDIRAARQKAGLSQEELASRVGVSLRSIGNYERSATVPRSALPRLQVALGIELDSGSDLQRVSDAALLAEIARRFDLRRKEGGSGGDTHAITQAPERAAQRIGKVVASAPVPAEKVKGESSPQVADNDSAS